MLVRKFPFGSSNHELPLKRLLLLFYLTAKNICLLVLAVLAITRTIFAATTMTANGLPELPSITDQLKQQALIMEEREETSIGQFYQLPTKLDKIKTLKPVIGILTEVLRDYKRFTSKRHFHIAASYVKWVESAGGQVLPILLNKDDAYYEQVFNQTNGLLFPGGDNLLDPNKNTPMMVAAKKLYKLAIEANNRGDYYPIWGTCLGMELLSVLTANRNVLQSCSAIDVPLIIEFNERGRLFAPSDYANLPFSPAGTDYSKVVLEAISTKNLTYNYHMKCLTDDGLKRANLDKFYRPLAYSLDVNNFEFIAIFEAISYPFYGVQFHPEKPPFEFSVQKSNKYIPHSRESIAVSRYFADFFITQAQLSSHKAKSQKQLDESLIYAYTPMYTALKGDVYEQRYLFPYEDNGSNSDEEFIDHVPADDEVIPEDVTTIIFDQEVDINFSLDIQL